MGGGSLFSTRIFAALALCAFVFGGVSWAHKPSDSYLRIDATGENLAIQWDISLKDLEMLVGLDIDQNRQISWGEVKQRGLAIAAHASSRLKVEADGKPCELIASDLLFVQHSDGGYAVLVFDTDQSALAKNIVVQYSLLFDMDPTHRGLVLYENKDVTSSHVITPDSGALTIETGDAGLWRSFVEYTWEGMWHIWIGLDHVLFLVTLLLTSVLIYRENRWQYLPSFGKAAKAVLKIVTVFTIAHSITLWLSVMEIVVLPSRAVEVVIALSIVVAALLNLYPVNRIPAWVIAFSFGLIHGFGFANVLIDLGLSSTSLAICLLGFNVGVEIGQLAIVIVVLPIVYQLRRYPFYRKYVVRFGSMLIIGIAMIWVLERVLNTQIFG